jgi:preprotein translocase subunit SecG
METIQLVQLINAILLIVVILLQNKGAQVSGLFGGGGAVYLTKRGIEKKLYTATIILAVLFFVISLVSIAID